jgi:PAS domain S-box-containing protein
MVGLAHPGGLVGAIGLLMRGGQALRFPALIEAFASHVTALLTRREAEQALRRSEERFRSLFENAGDALILLGSDLSIIELHDTPGHALGLAAEQAVGRAFAEVFHSWREVGSELARSAPHLLAGGAPLRRAAVPWRNHDGPVYLDLVAYGVPMGNDMRIAVVGRDVTQITALRQALQRKERAEQLGQFAGRVAHDFGHRLQIIMTQAEGLERHVGGDAAAASLAHGLIDQVLRARELTGKLVAYAKGDRTRIELYPLGPLLLSQERALRQAAGESVSLAIQVEEGMIFVRCDESHVQRILANLVGNARDAMPDGGHILIHGGVQPVDGDLARALDLDAGLYAVIEVADNGEGIAAEHLPRIFEPLFSVKHHGIVGSGMGLAMALSMMRQQNGHITAESHLGQGTAMRLYLPMLDPRELGDLEGDEPDAVDADRA